MSISVEFLATVHVCCYELSDCFVHSCCVRNFASFYCFVSSPFDSVSVLFHLLFATSVYFSSTPSLR